MVRVLKPSGSIWVNLGDKYAGGGGFSPTSPSNVARASDTAHQDGSFTVSPSLKTRLKGGGVTSSRAGVPTKSLIGVPWRYALRCIDDLGLILRAEVIWSKPNGLPESVTDRVRRSHETWFHFTKAPRYFSAVDEVREPHVGGSTGLAATFARPNPSHDLVPGQGYTQHRADRESVPAEHPLGKLPGSVWTIPTQPLRVPEHLGVDHFAAFPMEWPRRIIRGWSPSGVCVACGEGRRPVATKHHERPAGDWNPARAVENRPVSLARPSSEVTITGYACACPEPTAPTRPAVVLDPFGGTGTTALVARALGRHGISVDMSADYCRLAEWRTNDPGELARAMQVDKPPTELPDQLDMFGGDAA